MATDRLYDLFMALFRTEPELRRFLGLAGLTSVEQRLAHTEGESLRATAADASALLQDMDLVRQPLFTALARRAPDRADDIWDVARSFGVEPDADWADYPVMSPPPPTSAGDEPLPPMAKEIAVPKGYEAFAAELDAALDASVPPAPEEQALEPDRWPWTAVAGVLGSFRPAELRPLPGAPPELPAVTALASVVFTTATGRWALEDRVRYRVLERLERERRLPAAVAANRRVEDAHRDALDDLLTYSAPPPLARLSTAELGVWSTVLRWADAIGRDVEQLVAAFSSALERRSLIDPLRRLVGEHFHGRSEQESRIERHIFQRGGSRALAVTGPGGSGKSSLVGKVLLGLEARVSYEPVSFAYVDFDKARHNARNPAGLVEQIARQLRLLYAVDAEVSLGLRGLESMSAGTDSGLAAEILDIDLDQHVGLGRLVHELGKRLEAIPHPGVTPLVLILDTLEEVQLKGPGPVDDLRDLLRRFAAELPDMKLVLCGRGDLHGLLDEGTEAIELGDLADGPADEVLASLGVASSRTRRLVIDRFGGNPLVLHLAAEALRRMETAERAFGGALAEADVLAAVGVEQLQGMLYERILGHIADPEIVKIAHPGLAVRRVDVDVIRDVLSKPCGLDPADAHAIFERLQREVSMFDVEEDGALRHRQDVRRLMLRSMATEPKVAAAVAEIHPLAVAHYASRSGPVAQAEEIYHRLMSGQDPRSLTRRMSSRVRELLYPALEDPLPPAADTWLRRRLGLIDDAQERASWDQRDWEAVAEDRVRSYLASGDVDGASRALAERDQRLPGSRLYPLEVAVLIARGRHDEAMAVLERGVRSCSEVDAVDTQLELAEQATRLATERKNPLELVTAALSAATLADRAGDVLRAIEALTRSVSALQSIDADAEAERLAETVAERFAALSGDVLRENPELVRAVMQTVGMLDSTVLTRAALSLGDTTREEDAVFRDDAFVLGRLLAGTTPEARSAMNLLAAEVGLAEDRWTPAELAASAMKGGRTGQAVMLGLDYAQEDSEARQTVVEGLARPIEIGDTGWRSGT